MGGCNCPAHDGLLHATIDARDGYVFTTGGDGLAAAFARAGDAVRAGPSMPKPRSWRGGMAGGRVDFGADGVAFGRGGQTENGFFGAAVNQPHQVGSSAHGGR